MPGMNLVEVRAGSPSLVSSSCRPLRRPQLETTRSVRADTLLSHLALGRQRSLSSRSPRRSRRVRPRTRPRSSRPSSRASAQRLRSTKDAGRRERRVPRGRRRDRRSTTPQCNDSPPTRTAAVQTRERASCLMRTAGSVLAARVCARRLLCTVPAPVSPSFLRVQLARRAWVGSQVASIRANKDSQRGEPCRARVQHCAEGGKGS